MNNIQNLLSNNAFSIDKVDLEGISKIDWYTFYEKNILSINFSDTINTIYPSNFNNSTFNSMRFGKNKIDFFGPSLPESLSDFYLDELDEKSIIGGSVDINETNWFKSFPVNQMILGGNNKILIANTVQTPSTGFIIPESVVNLGPESCGAYNTVDSNFTTFTIPDHIKYVQNAVFGGEMSSLQKLTTIGISASVEEINGLITCDNYTTTLIFKHPPGKYIKLPEPGAGDVLTAMADFSQGKNSRFTSGMAYYKSSRALTVYTDNEYIKNYDWATDNATVTFYPLSSAPAGV